MPQQYKSLLLTSLQSISLTIDLIMIMTVAFLVDDEECMGQQLPNTKESTGCMEGLV